MVVVVVLDAVGFLKMYILYRQREGWVVDGYSICIALWYPNLIRDLHTAQSAVVVEPLSRWRMCVLYLAPLERDYTHSLYVLHFLWRRTHHQSLVCVARRALRVMCGWGGRVQQSSPPKVWVWVRERHCAYIYWWFSLYVFFFTRLLFTSTGEGGAQH